jgi:excisionase family DNA binding protein
MPSSAGKIEILTIRELAQYLKVNERTIYRLVSGKKIPAFKVGGSWRFSLADIDVWIKEQSVEGNQTVREHEGAEGKRAADGGQN